ncbi:MAG TPA: protein-L-isoaspartate(D-aspartate) O-methyltransferase [Xanthomonadaceae bacterium]|nr:protein-L-isoaspartate(D-aspartate) O-methyltransferase [Xanthomonadaceae bacterium]
MTPLFRHRPETQGQGMTSQRARDRLIERLRADGIRDERVLTAMRQVPRHLFIDEALASRAYEDTALPIGKSQTISQPWVVARMTEALLEQSSADQPVRKRVLEIGTGSGYQAAVLSLLVDEVYTVERIDELLRVARKRFRTLGFANIRTRHDDGRAGWAEHAPFDAIIVTAAGAVVEPALLAQLHPHGLLVAPVGGTTAQSLQRWRNTGERWQPEALCNVVFVPLLPGVV